MQKFASFKVVRYLLPGATGTLAFTGNVFYSTANNPAANAVLATAGVDYTTTSGTINFPASESDTEQESEIIKVPIAIDSTPEGNETFLVKLTTPINGQLSSTDAEGVVTITDNDGDKLPHVVVESATLAEGGDGTTKEMVFKVKLVNSTTSNPMAVGGEVVVTYSTEDGTATTADADYLGVLGGTITFAPGETEKEIRIVINGDNIDEADEAFSLDITGATFKASGETSTSVFPSGNLPASATGTITNDDLTITLDPLTQGAEGNGTNTVTFTARIGQASTHPVSFKVKTQNGTATVGDDYVALAETLLTFEAGETEKTFTITIKGDFYAESDETFTVLLSDATNATLAETSRTYTILNDDAAPSLTIGDESIVEGDNGQANLVFTVVLTGGILAPVTFDFATQDGTAKSSGPLVDYLASIGSLEFDPSAASSQTKTISIPIFGDTWKELNEIFSVKLSNAKLGGAASGVTILDDTATGEIVDNGDTKLGVIIGNQRVVEGNSGTTNLNFTIETTAPVEGSALSLIANTRIGTAGSNDFTALVNSTVNIPVGESQATVTVAVKGDSAFEAAEFMFLDITGFSDAARPVNHSANTASVYGVILNDDVNIVNSRQFQYVDKDGDLVTVKFSKGTLRVQTGTTNSDTNHINFTELSALGGREIKTINVAIDGFAFNGVSINMVAKPQVLVTGEVLGDSKANVGSLQAAVLNSDLFQISSGIGLGNVKIPGNLGQLIAGNTTRPAGAASIEVGSFGADSNQGSVVLGPIGKLVVNGDFMGNLRVIGDIALLPIPSGGIGKIGTLVIKGALKGGDTDLTGRITFTGGIGNATIGSISGGAGQASATLASFGDEFNTRIGKLTVLGDFAGGAGLSSGQVQADSIGAISIGRAAKGSTPAVEGNLKGGTGKESGVIAASSIGSVFINGNIEGGDEDSSAFLLAFQKLGNTRITGSLIGADGESSGRIQAPLLTGSLTIEGDVRGGSGDESGLVFIQGTALAAANAKSITLGKKGVSEGGNLEGGTGESSGLIQVNGNVGSFIAYGNIKGGKGESSGSLIVNNTLNSAFVKGSIIGGNTDASGANGGVTSLVGSGHINAGAINSITVEGAIQSGENNGTALAKSGGIFSSSTIGKLNVGSVVGNENVPVVISALRSIGNATFGGNVDFLELLAGYANADEDAPRGVLLDAGATIGNVIVKGTLTASSIVAGVHAGNDGKFGTADDTVATNGKPAPNNVPANQAAISRIASVVLNAVGVPADVDSDAAYGIVAENVKAVKIGGVAVPLTSGASNDQTSIGPADSKLQILEI